MRGTTADLDGRSRVAGEDGLWREIPPPQRGFVLMLPDPERDRILVAGGRRLVADWCLRHVGEPRWEPVQGATAFPRPQFESTVFDSRAGRWIVFYPQWPQALLGFEVLEPGDPPSWSSPSLSAESPVPGERYGGVAAFDVRRNRVLLFGGIIRDKESHDVFLDELWILDLEGSPTWHRAEGVGGGPDGRYGHTAVYDSVGDRFVVIGGWGSGHTPRTDVWSFSGDSQRWTQVMPGGDPLATLGAATTIADHATGDLYLFDARDTNFHELGDWRLTWSPAPRWSRVLADADSTSPGGFAWTYDAARDRYLCIPWSHAEDDLHVFELTLGAEPRWTALGRRPLPPPRFGAASAIDEARGRAFVFGGAATGGVYHNDVWSVSLEDPESWTRILLEGEPPPPRHEPVGVYDAVRNRVIVHGGWTYPSTYFDDVWELDLSGAPTWRRHFPEGEAPPPRRAAAATLDPLRRRMIVFGGNAGTTRFADVWALSLEGALRWEKLRTTGTPPAGRWDPSLVYDPRRDRLIVHGGGGGTTSFDDTWALSLETLEWSFLGGGGPSLARHRAVWDPLGNRMLVFGGYSFHNDAFSSGGGIHVWHPGPEARWGYLLPARFSGWWNIAGVCLYDPRHDRVFGFGGSEFVYPSNTSWLLELERHATAAAWLLGVQFRNDRAIVTWQSAGGPGTSARVEKRVMGGVWMPWGTVVADGTSRWVVEDLDVRPGQRYAYRVLVAGASPAAEALVDVPTEIDRLLGAFPHPAVGDLRLAFRLMQSGPARLDLYDTAGRRVWGTRWDRAAADLHVVPVGRIPAGVYWARLETPRRREAGRVVVVP